MGAVASGFGTAVAIVVGGVASIVAAVGAGVWLRRGLVRVPQGEAATIDRSAAPGLAAATEGRPR
jgi:hypothetical protein